MASVPEANKKTEAQDSLFSRAFPFQPRLFKGSMGWLYCSLLPLPVSVIIVWV